MENEAKTLEQLGREASNNFRLAEQKARSAKMILTLDERSRLEEDRLEYYRKEIDLARGKGDEKRIEELQKYFKTAQENPGGIPRTSSEPGAFQG